MPDQRRPGANHEAGGATPRRAPFAPRYKEDKRAHAATHSLENFQPEHGDQPVE